MSSNVPPGASPSWSSTSIRMPERPAATRFELNSVRSRRRNVVILLLSVIGAAGAPVGSLAGEPDPPPAAQLPAWCKEPEPAAYAALERVQVSQPWFDVYRVRPGVFALYEGKQ